MTKPVSCQVLHSFNGGKTNRVLSRSLLFQRPGSVGQLLATFGNESLNMVRERRGRERGKRGEHVLIINQFYSSIDLYL